MPFIRQSLPTAKAIARRLALKHFPGFHTSAPWQSELANHYETLGLQTKASPEAIKKQFYTLSKSHHPDHNPHDPQASQRFIKISEAYATLGNPLKRERYDKDIGRAQVGRSQSTPRGSHSSASTPFGSRPASGLSRRRTQFKGPPPSYYRNGGWGSHSAKRQAQAEGFSDSHRDGNAARSTSTGGGADPGTHQSGFGNDVPHFDQDAHYRTQQSQEQRWIRRKSNQGKEYSHEGADVILMFLIIGGVVCAAFSVPIWVMGPNSSKIKDEMPHP